MADAFDPLWPLAGVVVGAACTFLVTRYEVNRRLAAERQERVALNLERLHKAISDLDRWAKDIQLDIHMRVIRGRVMSVELGRVNFDEFAMLVDYYAPSLVEERMQMLSYFDELFACGSDANQSSVDKGDHAELLARTNGAASKISLVAVAAKAKLAKRMEGFDVEREAWTQRFKKRLRGYMK